MWKYGAGSISACRCSSHSCVCAMWHLGQLRLPQEWKENTSVLQVSQPDLAAECGGAAVEDVLDGAPMRGQHRRAVSRDVFCREAVEHIGDLDHDRASEAGHQPIK